MAVDQNTTHVRALSRIQRGLISSSEHMDSLGPGVNFDHNIAVKRHYAKPLMKVFREYRRFTIRKPPHKLEVLPHVQHTEGPRPNLWLWTPK